MEVFIKILTKQPDYPEYVDNQSKMVIDGLLEKEPKRRFSAGMFFSDNSPKFMNTGKIEVMVEFHVVPMNFFGPDS